MKKSALIALCLLWLFACKKDKQTEDTPDVIVPPAATGSLSGTVSQYDQFGVMYTSGLNTTTVSMEGKTTSTVTDEQGKYSFSGVTSGTYTLVFKKNGCGLIKKPNAIYKAGDTLSFNAQVADIPVFSITTAYVKDTSWFSGTLAGIYYNAAASVNNPKASMVAILGKSAAIDIANPASYLNYATLSRIDSLDFNRFQSYPLLKQSYSFKKDSLVYVKIYPVSSTGASYFDSKLEKPVYTAYGSPYPTIFTLTIP